MKKLTYWLSLIAFILSLVTIVLFFVKVSPNSVVDSNTFISVLAAFIGISVTFLLGFQIYNAMELKDKIRKVDELQSTLEGTLRDINVVKTEQSQGFNIIQSRLYKDTFDLQTHAFTLFLCAIHDTLELNRCEDIHEWMLDELKDRMIALTLANFSGGLEQRKNKIDTFRNDYKEFDKLIRNHKQFFTIRYRYIEYMNKFERRLNLFEQGKNASLTEIEKEI